MVAGLEAVNNLSELHFLLVFGIVEDILLILLDLLDDLRCCFQNAAR